MKKEISLEKVAERAGVAKSTVSFVLNNKNKVAPHTRERVLAAMRELGYSKGDVPEPDPLNMPFNGGMKNILIYVNPIVRDEEVIRTYLNGLRQFAAEDRQISFTFALSSPIVEASLQLQFLEETAQPQGILIIGIDTDSPFIQQALQTGKPCLILNRVTSLSNLSYVSINHRKAGQDAADYLLELGHRHFVVIYEKVYNEPEIIRLESFLAALSGKAPEAKVAFAKHYKLPRQAEPYRARNLSQLLQDEKLHLNSKVELKLPSELTAIQQPIQLTAGFNPTCVVAANDYFANTAQAGLQAAGLRVPGDVSVMSFNSSSLALKATPQITAIDEFWHEQGYLAGQNLRDLLNYPNLRAQRIEVKHRLVVRGSTAQPKKY